MTDSIKTRSFKFFLLTLFIGKVMTSQSQDMINNCGVGNTWIGMDIKTVKEAVPFAQFSKQDLFEVYPSPDHFFFIDNPQLYHTADLSIRYAFICTNDSGIVTRISLFINDSTNTAQAVLTRIFGEPDLRGDSTTSFGGASRWHMMWSTPEHNTVYLIKNDAQDPDLHIPITLIHIYNPKAFENFNDSYVEYRYIE